MEAKEKATGFLEEAKNEEKGRKNQISVLEERLMQREQMVDKRLTD